MNRRPVGKQVVQCLIDQRGEISAGVAEMTTCGSAVQRSNCSSTAALAATQPAAFGRFLTGKSARSIAMPRPWRLGTTMISAPMILQLIPAADGQRLIAEYVDRGGAWPVPSAPENATLLEFLASRLPAPSHALSLCRMEIALTRARLGAALFVEPEYRSIQERSNRDVRARIEHEAWACIERAMQGGAVTARWDDIERTSWDSLEGAIWDGIERDARLRLEFDAWQTVERSARNQIERGIYASLVWFHADPEAVLRALRGAPPPPVGTPAYPIVVGPGVPNLCRVATPEEVVLWASLPADDTAPDLVERLLAEGIVKYTD
jgi:hypothetical protein